MVPALVVGVPRRQSLCQVGFCTLGAAIHWSSGEQWSNFWVVLHRLGCDVVTPWVDLCWAWSQMLDEPLGRLSLTGLPLLSYPWAMALCEVRSQILVTPWGGPSQCPGHTWNLFHCRRVQTRFPHCWILCDSDSKFLPLSLKIFSRPGLSIYSCILILVSQSMRFSVCLALPSCGFSRGLFRNGFSVRLTAGCQETWVFWPLPFLWECCFYVQLLPPTFFFFSALKVTVTEGTVQIFWTPVLSLAQLSAVASIPSYWDERAPPTHANSSSIDSSLFLLFCKLSYFIFQISHILAQLLPAVYSLEVLTYSPTCHLHLAHSLSQSWAY